MKLVTAVLRPAKLDDVNAALTEIELPGITVTEVRGFGRQRGHTDKNRDQPVEFLTKVRVEVLTQDDGAERVHDAIVAAARTGQIGDGKVWITHVEAVTRVRTGEKGNAAV